jgi:hypothetical protein
VPGLTPAVVKTIIDRRPFLTITDLDTFLAQSFSREQRTEVYRRLFVQINLNTASDEEILLIPGLGQRMLGEFKEYRPYRIFQLIMLAFIASGVAGIALHYQGNVEFELELQPDAAGLGLFGRR